MRKPIVFALVGVAAFSFVIAFVLLYYGGANSRGTNVSTNGDVNSDVNDPGITTGNTDAATDKPVSCDERLASPQATTLSAQGAGGEHDEFQVSSQLETIGNNLDISLTRGRSGISITDGSQMTSFRFTAKYSGDVSALAVYTSNGGNRTMLVGIQPDRDGFPSGDWLVSDGYGSIKAQSNGFVVANLAAAPNLRAGSIYHLVVKPELTNEDSTKFAIPVTLLVYPANGLAQPYNPERLDSVWPDLEMNSLFFDGRSWKEMAKWPDFAVIYSDGRMEGQPYTLNAPWVVHGSVYVGQIIEPTYDYTLHEFSFLVGSRESPSDSICYEIRDWEDNVLAAGQFAEKGEITGSGKVWHKVSLESGLQLNEGEKYRIILLAPGTSVDNAYELFGHEFSYNSDLGYGGTDIQLTISYNAGKKWDRWDDADAVFTLGVSRPST
jgi:hypothetical protein